MILTITLNSAIDRVLLLDELTPGGPMCARGEVVSVGGKGLDASVVLRHLGVETVGLAFVGGETGRQLQALLVGYGILPELLWVEGETRTIYVLAESRHKRVSHIKLGGLRIEEKDLQRLMQAYRQRLPESAWVICSGSLPEDVPVDTYAWLARESRERGVPFLVDCAGEALLATLPHRPDIAKLNWEEFEATFGVRAGSLEELASMAAEIARDCRMHNLVLTCAAEGVLALTQEGRYHALAPVQEVVNAAGAGDAVSSALAWRLSLGDPWPEALRWAAACAAAVVRTEGTADCRWVDVLALLPMIAVQGGPRSAG
ncbi:MAG: 1-phosphofructokinase family hexose kinase [Anaerolineae bacterium]